MNITEFRAWFEGYTEDLESPPTKKQWSRIKEQVGKIDGVPITYPVYVERYYPSTFWRPGTLMGGATGGSHFFGNVTTQNSGQVTIPFDSHVAMYAAGKAEALA